MLSFKITPPSCPLFFVYQRNKKNASLNRALNKFEFQVDTKEKILYLFHFFVSWG